MQIIVKNISHIFNKNSPLEFKALNNVATKINQGDYLAIIGETGSGKTTFIEHLNSLLIPETGTINWIFEHDFVVKKNSFLNNQKRRIKKIFSNEYHWLKKVNKVDESKREFVSRKLKDFDYDKRKNELFNNEFLVNTNQDIVLRRTFTKKNKKSKILRQHVGVVFQFAEYQLFEQTIEKDIMFGPMAFGVSKEEAKKRAAIYLEQVGLPPEYLERNPLDLSGGQKRRVALAGILAIEPDVLILDEPTAGLDPAGVKEILDIFDRLNENGKTVIMVTHDLNNVLERSKRTIVFSKGECVLDGDTHEILNDIKLVKKYNLDTPQVIELKNKILDKLPHLNPPKLTSIHDLIIWLNEEINKKRGA